MDQTLITRIVEASLLAASQPLTLAQLHALFPEDAPAPADSVEQALESLQAACADRGVELVELASGFRYQVKSDVHPWVARLWTERQTRYTRATLETLALIAYRQPVTRGEIEQVRGVAVSSNIIKALEEREWIRVVGHRDVPGKPALFGTTKVFLDYFGLKRLDELPALSELKDLGELEPQFQFDGEPAPRVIEAGGLGEPDPGSEPDGDREDDDRDAVEGAPEADYDATAAAGDDPRRPPPSEGGASESSASATDADDLATAPGGEPTHRDTTNHDAPSQDPGPDGAVGTTETEMDEASQASPEHTRND
ncbi:SMC-Scp complex subunit ScpB [Lysobacter sp. A3-1-A15]|uniref:SMC-Scp complex subunit ScpB n=1 Tax=Novilysobacter viscosus TaxID=3098602 RepID=UPI002ED95E5A